MIESKLEKVMARMDSGLEGLDAIANDYMNVFTIGKPGTGKTTMWSAVGAALKMPVYSVPITMNTEEDTFQGMTKVVDGGFNVGLGLEFSWNWNVMVGPVPITSPG